MKAVCPKDPTHTGCYTTAAMQETWLVDNEGNWIETLCSDQILHKPSPDNIWECRECGEECAVTR